MAQIIAVDTNVLVRVLIDDEEVPAQSAAARRLIESADSVYICAAVLIETIWTLARRYGYPRQNLAQGLLSLLNHKKYRIESEGRFRSALARFEAGNIEFADAVALQHAEESGATLHTFDRKLAKLPGAQLLRA